MMSAAVLAIGVLGVAATQVLAAGQNGMARRTSRAAMIARDFTESVQRWEFNDPRLVDLGCNTGTAVDETYIGTGAAPTNKLEYTALPSSDPVASSLAATSDALWLNGSTYDGLSGPYKTGATPVQWSSTLLGNTVKDR